MASISSISNETQNTLPFGDASALNELKIDDFLDLMIAELQNQDPLNPLDNAELLAQIGQIREVAATDQLTETLDAVLLGQNVASATSLMGQEVQALATDGTTVLGIVDRVTINNGQPEIHINASSRATACEIEGQIEAGTYRYKVVFERPDGQYGAIDLGPITTTGTNGLDSSILLSNLPATNGPKMVYRTDASGEGEYHLVNYIIDPDAESYIDSASNVNLSNATLTFQTVAEYGGKRYTATLNNVTEIRARN
ncbi:MAG: hypothetical protein JW829_12595 [Pirellulales bacterium]|nr:hypothetical protein [Pirellulales bacterium]